MEFRQLAHFVAVAEDGSFTKAARRMHIVQSGISASISGLERELNVELFRRLPQRIELTAAGRALLAEARRALDAVAAGSAAARSASGSLSGVLRVQVVPAALPLLQFSRVLREFQLAHPGVTIEANELVSTKLDPLRDGTFDLVIGSRHGENGITSVKLATSPMGVICAETHPLAGRASLTLRAIADEAFIYPAADSTMRPSVDRVFGDMPGAPERRIAASGATLVTSLVREGVGLMIAPQVVELIYPRVRWIPLRPTLPPWVMYASHVGATPPTPESAAFLDALQRGPAERRQHSR